LALVAGIAAPALAADVTLKGYSTVLPVTHAYPPIPGTRVVAPLPSFTYNVTASSDLGGGTYSGTILGASPSAKTKGTTTLTVQIVPLDITINDGTTTINYNPNAADPCNSGHKATVVVNQSPIFTKVAWTMNGVNVGTTQYIDAFQRAEFWKDVKGTGYHLKLKRVVLPTQIVKFSGATNGANVAPGTSGRCGYIGVVNINTLDSIVQKLITGPLAGKINVGTFPIFITKDVVESESGVSLTQCCVLGYHSGFTVGGNLQIYSPFSFDSSGAFGGDVNTLAHEMGEAVNDPSGNNATPVWGNIGQVLGRCQSNFEVGDPLSEGFGTPTNTFVVTAKNGLTYHLQELAFFNWFFGGTSLGAGGMFSDNGSFKGDAILCSAGGGTH
jgi:hypothetical protein